MSKKSMTSPVSITGKTKKYPNHTKSANIIHSFGTYQKYLPEITPEVH